MMHFVILFASDIFLLSLLDYITFMPCHEKICPYMRCNTYLFCYVISYFAEFHPW
ncbi:hypothetical protein ACP275_10G121700 [Erythranthe tilingii]